MQGRGMFRVRRKGVGSVLGGSGLRLDYTGGARTK